VKDERFIDRFDRVFSQSFKGVAGEAAGQADGPARVDLPVEWLRRLADRYLSEAEKREIESLGGFDKLMETLRQRLAEQKERHQGGNKWIGTGGTSPFGAGGYNPDGVRIGQEQSRHRRAVKVWDERQFRNLDDSVELGARNIKLALKRLRRWVREGAAEELDLDETIRATADHGWLDIKTRPERKNRVKLLVFFDIGGSMDDHLKVAEQLFSAVKSEFNQLEYFYFHNCLYDCVWKDNNRRRASVISTEDVLRIYGPDYKVIFAGDAAMSPYEISMAGGSVEHWNKEAGAVWLNRVTGHFRKWVWLNPLPESQWSYTQSIGMIRELFAGKMYGLTLGGLEAAAKELSR
jgi:uncharacterized protein with von Willebrand factor type A (vWA) domain